MRWWKVTLLVGCLVAAGANLLVLTGGGASSGPTVREPDCVLVLGAGLTPQQTPSLVLEDRLQVALDLHRAGAARKILVSGDHRTAAYDEPNAMRAWLEARGVPAADIYLDHAGLDTYSSMWRARHVFGARRMVVTTQHFHLARALWTARALGIDADGVAADRRVYRGTVWQHARELASRTKAVIDVAIHRRPRHAGPPVPLTSEASTTRG